MNGWKSIAISFATVIVGGIALFFCTDGLKEVKEYPGLRIALAQTQAKADEIEADVVVLEERMRKDEQDVAALKATVMAMDARTTRMEGNLYQFLVRQPGITPIPPPPEKQATSP